MPGTFIDVKVAESIKGDAEMAKKLEEVCPVSIFVAKPSGIEIDEDNLDECTLCDLCINAAPSGSVEVIKLYES